MSLVDGNNTRRCQTKEIKKDKNIADAIIDKEVQNEKGAAKNNELTQGLKEILKKIVNTEFCHFKM